MEQNIQEHNIVSQNIEKAGERELTSYPLSLTTCLPAVKLVCFPYVLIDAGFPGSPYRCIVVPKQISVQKEDTLYFYALRNFWSV